ncbi:MAG: hypothetical protein GXO43_05095 [Crenarchaeota archaeon]|nr:hypothetical protein [Thermoproteota archaeon]
MIRLDQKTILDVYRKYYDQDLDIYNANRFLALVGEVLAHLANTGVLDLNQVRDIAMKIRDAIVDTGGEINLYVMELLGILENAESKNDISEALNLSRRLFREDRFEKLEV